MEAYVLFARGEEAREALRFEEKEEDIGCASDSESSAAGSSTSSSSSGGVELADDASSSGSTTGRFEMGALMTQLPIKRGLSKFFDGKSQSFASLAEVGALEDLPKPPAKRLKTSRSFVGVGLKDAHRGRHSAAEKQPSRARLSAPRRLVRPRPLVTARPAPAAGQPLLFA